ncbi:unnamed protein product [Adineta steineri]|uniref:Uncharacterized protein n=2 Tax=Adineta steineri TaxID=433720 RepID=A0A815XTI9_9BILA|nr:unnamed protein product [Adineta steineri]CAF1561583.1 unnamed protein product [Adineta steineri]
MVSAYHVYTFLMISGVLLISIGFISTANYIKIRNKRRQYMNTTCLLTNYECIDRQCRSCVSANGWRGKSCEFYQCWDEYLTILYSISNGTSMKTSLAFNSIRECTQHIKSGNNYTCFYQKLDVNSIELDLPDGRVWIILMITSFSLFGIVIIFGLLFRFFNRTEVDITLRPRQDSIMLEERQHLNSN